jgi:hypothetical protein
MRRHLTNIAAALVTMAVLSGCLMEATIDQNGGGTMTVKYRLATAEQFAAAKQRLQSPQVTVVNAAIDADKWATFDIKFADVTQLSTAPFFEKTKITLADGEGGTKTLTVKYVNPSHAKLPADLIAYFGNTVTISLHLPGEVVQSNATKTTGTSAQWTYTLADFSGLPQLDLSVSYKRPKA